MSVLDFDASRGLPSPVVPRKRRRWPVIVSMIGLSLVAVVLGVGFAYATHSAQEWRDAAVSSDKALDEMTTQRDDARAEVDDLRGRLDKVTADFNASTERIRSLSNEKAQAGDNFAVAATLVAKSQNVTAGMDACIKDLQKLQTYLVNFDSYEPSSLLTYARQINEGCNKARTDSDNLSKELAR